MVIDQQTQIRINRFIQKMPPLPLTVSKVLEVTRNPKTDAKALNDVVSLDPVLTGKVLKLVNSAYYSLSNQVTSLVRAIIMLGINTVKNLVLSTAVISTVKKAENFNALDMDSFWKHSIGVGVISKKLAQSMKIDPKKLEEYFVAGLLHDIGKIPLNAEVSDEYIKAISYARQNKAQFSIIETEFFGLNHADIGIRISELWKLNKPLHYTIQYHHAIDDCPDEYREFVAVISLANIIACRSNIGFAGDSVPAQDEDKLMEITQLKWKDIEDVESSAEDAIKKAMIFLNLI